MFKKEEDFRKHKSSLNKFSQLLCQKILNLEELIFQIESCIVNFAEFIFASFLITISFLISFLISKSNRERGSSINVFSRISFCEKKYLIFVVAVPKK